MVGSLDHHGAGGVVTGPACAPGDLVELAGLQQARADAVVLRQGREDDGPDRHVDPDAKGVGAADDLEEAGLGQLFHQPPVLGQHAGVVDADAVPDQT